MLKFYLRTSYIYFSYRYPKLIYKNTLNEILVSWSPVGSDTVCGPVTYNITVMPSHGMIMMINDTVYNIIGLYYNTNYTITVYATNNHGSGEPATVIVKTKPLPPGMHNNIINACITICTVVMYDYIAYDYMLQAQLVIY